MHADAALALRVLTHSSRVTFGLTAGGDEQLRLGVREQPALGSARRYRRAKLTPNACSAVKARSAHPQRVLSVALRRRPLRRTLSEYSIGLSVCLVLYWVLGRILRDHQQPRASGTLSSLLTTPKDLEAARRTAPDVKVLTPTPMPSLVCGRLFVCSR